MLITASLLGLGVVFAALSGSAAVASNPEERKESYCLAGMILMFAILIAWLGTSLLPEREVLMVRRQMYLALLFMFGLTLWIGASIMPFFPYRDARMWRAVRNLVRSPGFFGKHRWRLVSMLCLVLCGTGFSIRIDAAEREWWSDPVNVMEMYCPDNGVPQEDIKDVAQDFVTWMKKEDIDMTRSSQAAQCARFFECRNCGK